MLTRFLRILTCFSLAMCLLSHLPSVQAEHESDIRVYLRRLKIEDMLHLQVQGTYVLDNENMLLSDGAEAIILLRDNSLIMHMDGLSVNLGDSISFVRMQHEGGSSLMLQGSDNKYEGDLSLTIEENAIFPVLAMNIEEYVMGVVPYEMGDSFPLEALKAQAIAARTYALQKRGAYELYDVEDTTNDQAFKGRSSSSPLSEQAVMETAGLCGVYNGKLAQCYYSASNGGQTELGQHVWPVDNPEKYGYMDMRDDPYDLENEASSVKRYTLNKRPGEQGVGAALHSVLVSALAPQLNKLGYTAEDDLIRIDEIVSLQAGSPKFQGASRLMTELTFSIKLSAREAIYRDTSRSETHSATPAPELTPTPTPAPTSTPSYSPYTRLETTFVVSVPYFPDAEKAMGLSINVYQNELISVVDIGSAYMIESRRFGHGVGMSQRGAQQMAKEYGMSCEQILSFYYPGMSLASYDTLAKPLPEADVRLLTTPSPTASPTPRPTLMPATLKKSERGAYVAVVSNIAEDSSLNLRAAPSLSSDVIRRLLKDQRLIVLSSQPDGWVHVRTDVVEGYVRSEYIQTAE